LEFVRAVGRGQWLADTPAALAAPASLSKDQTNTTTRTLFAARSLNVARQERVARSTSQNTVGQQLCVRYRHIGITARDPTDASESAEATLAD